MSDCQPVTPRHGWLRFQSVDKTGSHGWFWRAVLVGNVQYSPGRGRTVRRKRTENSCVHQATSLGEPSETGQASLLAHLPTTSFATFISSLGAVLIVRKLCPLCGWFSCYPCQACKISLVASVLVINTDREAKLRAGMMKYPFSSLPVGRIIISLAKVFWSRISRGEPLR